MVLVMCNQSHHQPELKEYYFNNNDYYYHQLAIIRTERKRERERQINNVINPVLMSFIINCSLHARVSPLFIATTIFFL